MSFRVTVTTTAGQVKSTATSPGQASLALPYTDSFDSDAAGTEARYLMDQQGAFEVAVPQVRGAGQPFRSSLMSFLDGNSEVLERLVADHYEP